MLSGISVEPSAHSFMEDRRFYTDRNIKSFLTVPFEENEREESSGGGWEEFAMLRLRLSDGLDTEELSKKFGYSERHLHRIIKNCTGNNFRILIMLERITHANSLLKNTTLSLDEISKVLGLKSKEYFCKLFKKQTGMTPMEYRESVKGN